MQLLGRFSFPRKTRKSFAFRSWNPGLGIQNPKTKTVFKILNFYLKRILAACPQFKALTIG